MPAGWGRLVRRAWTSGVVGSRILLVLILHPANKRIQVAAKVGAGAHTHVDGVVDGIDPRNRIRQGLLQQRLFVLGVQLAGIKPPLELIAKFLRGSIFCVGYNVPIRLRIPRLPRLITMAFNSWPNNKYLVWRAAIHRRSPISLASGR